MDHRKWFGNFHKIVLGVTLLSVSEVSLSPVYGEGEIMATVGCSTGTGLLGYWLGKRSVPKPLPAPSWGRRWGFTIVVGVTCVCVGVIAGHYLWPEEKGKEGGETDGMGDVDNNAAMAELQAQYTELQTQYDALQEEYEAAQDEYCRLNPMVAAFEAFGETPARFMNFGAMGDAGEDYRRIKQQLRLLEDFDGFRGALQGLVWQYRDGEDANSPLSPTATKRMSLQKLQKQILAFITEIHEKSLNTTNNLSVSIDRLTRENEQLLTIVRRLLCCLQQQMNGTGGVFGILFPDNKMDNPWREGETSLEKVKMFVMKHSGQNAASDGGGLGDPSGIVALLPEDGGALIPEQSFREMEEKIKRLLEERDGKDQLAYFLFQTLRSQTGYLDNIFVMLFPSVNEKSWWHNVMEHLDLYQKKAWPSIPYQGKADIQLALPETTGSTVSLDTTEAEAAFESIEKEIERLQKAQKEAEEAAKQVKTKESELERLQRALDQLKEQEAAELNNQLTQSQKMGKELDEWKVKYQAQQAQDVERQKRMAELEREINQIKAELAASANKVKELETKAAEATQLQTQVVEIRKQIEVINTTHVDRNQLINDLDKLIVQYEDPRSGNAAVRIGLITLLKSIKEKYKTEG